jgi:16S rRNA (adenine1518-N6/adenine1519-N6)-dimethyltransferase
LIKAKKRFGQNFLKDESILEKIIQSMSNDELEVVEIGPGLGDLTRKLLDIGKIVSAFEIDLELCAFLKSEFEKELSLKRMSLICSDVLDDWGKKPLLDREYHLVANLPYYIATNIILKALGESECRSMIVMVQLEVAKKFAAKSGDREFSALSVLTQSIARAEVLFEVGREAFDPPPKVTSAVLRITKTKEFFSQDAKESLFESEKEFGKFKEFLRSSFKAPRKTLLKNLSQTFPKDRVISSLESLNLPQNIRPHQLRVKDYHLLFNNIK